MTLDTDPAVLDRAAEPVPPRRWLALGPVAALVVVAIAARIAAASDPPIKGLPTAGALTDYGLPITRLLFDLVAVTTIGTLLVALMLPIARRPTSPGRLEPTAARLLRVAAWSALGWAAVALLGALLTVSEVLGISIGEVVGAGGLLDLLWTLGPARDLLLAAVGAAVLSSYARWTTTRTGTAVLLALALGALLPVIFGGHASAAPDHDLTTSSLVVHVLAASLWVGGLGAMLLFLRSTPQLLAAVVPKYSVLALGCFFAVAWTGLLNAWLRAADDPLALLTSGYGVLLAAKVVLLAGLGVLGWRHRAASIPGLAQGRLGAFARLATVETAVMALTFGVAVALSRTSPPTPPSGARPAPSHGLGHATLTTEVLPFEPWRVLTGWRPDAVFVTIAVTALTCYLLAVRRVHGRGSHWPWQRSAAAGAAAAALFIATSGGLATYAIATFSGQVAHFLVLFILVPVLVALSAPGRLAQQARDQQARDQDPRGESRLARWLTDPVNALYLASTWVLGLYLTPVLAASLASLELRQAVNVGTLLVGTMFWSAVLGVDPAPAHRTRRVRMWVLAGLLAQLAVVGTRIFTSDTVLAERWYTDLDWSWVDPVADQRLGAALLLAVVTILGPLLLLAAAAAPANPTAGAAAAPAAAVKERHRAGRRPSR